MEQRVDGVRPDDGNRSQWFVHSSGGRHGPFDAVVNALWQGRPAVDESVGHRPDTAQQHRYRVSVFARTSTFVDTPCAVLGVGPFGDVKNYGDQNFYLSWYPLGLLARAEAIEPPVVRTMTDDARLHLAREIFTALSARLPWVERIRRAAVEVRVEGGWVYSQGRGQLDDPHASVHQRSRLGFTRVGTYYSVDTGKFSVAAHARHQPRRRDDTAIEAIDPCSLAEIVHRLRTSDYASLSCSGGSLPCSAAAHQ